MLTKEGCQARRERLLQTLEKVPDWIVISDPEHLMYFANYHQTPFIFRSTNGAAVLLLSKTGRTILVADSMLRGFADQAFVDEVVAPVWYNGQESAPHREAHLLANVVAQISKLGGGAFGLELPCVPSGVLQAMMQQFPAAQITAVSPVIHRLKRSKDADEVALLERSLRSAEAGMDAAMRQIVPGMTELDAFLLVQQASLHQLGETAGIYGDLVSGPRCEKVGGPPTDRVIQAGELVLLDFSIVLYGYRGDFANTFVCAGSPSNKWLHYHQACLEALKAAEALIAPGRPAKELDAAVRGAFDAHHLRDYFTSHSGHGIGLGHPDPPYLVPNSSDILQAGDVIAIEPGLYIAGDCGMRYEHNYLVTESGFRQLSRHALEIDCGKLK